MSETMLDTGDAIELNAASSKMAGSIVGNKFVFCTDAYKGSGGFADGSYLVMHSKEKDTSRRKANLYYQNYVKGVINSLIVPVFSSSPIRKIEGDGTDIFEAYLENCDNRGNKLERLNKEFQKYVQLHGVCFTVIDNFDASLLYMTWLTLMTLKK
jgi:hypothetical protein